MYVFISWMPLLSLASKVPPETSGGDVYEVKSFTLIRNDDRYFVAGPASAPDVHFYFSVVLVSVRHGVYQSFAECQFDIRFLTGNTLRSFNQEHQTVHQWGDRLNLAGHPGVDFQDGSTGVFS
jgi:hypothetical protein